MDIEKIQQSLKGYGIDGWLLCNFKNFNSVADRLMKLPPETVQSRRFYYFIPAEGTPKKLVHRIEPYNLDTLPGEKSVYLSWQSLAKGLRSLTGTAERIAMEYSPNNAIPYVSKIDAGTVELMRSIGKEVVSSANLIQDFEATLTDEQIDSHLKAAKMIRSTVHNAFDEIRTRISKAGHVKEVTIQKFIAKRHEEHNLVFYHPAIVAVNANAGNPHYQPTDEKTDIIGENDLVLIDLVGKLNMPNSIYADITWMGYTGDKIPPEFQKTFDICMRARNRGVEFLQEKISSNTQVHGYEVDDAVRAVVDESGYGEYFIHRTGHSIGEEVHGNGANMDNLETHDDRIVSPRTCFSVEPGIYTKAYGIRTELNIMIMPDKEVIVSGGKPQTEIIKI